MPATVTRAGTRPGSLSSGQVTELADYLQIELEDVLIELEANHAHYTDSLDAPRTAGDEDDAVTLADTVGADDRHYDLIDNKLAPARPLPKLPFAERQAAELRYQSQLTQRQIGLQMGCSQMQVNPATSDPRHRV